MPKGMLQAYAIKKPAFVFGIEDLMFVKDNPHTRLTASPFVPNFENVVFLGHAAPWKGTKGIEAVEGVNSAVAAGLRKAIGISKECKGIEGVVRVGDHYLPKKDICEIEKAGRKAPAPA